jgi:hypothetical protein
MSFGTPIGAIHPNQACTSKPFNVSDSHAVLEQKAFDEYMRFRFIPTS